MLGLPGQPDPPKEDKEYILVSDKTSEVLKSSESYQEVKKLAGIIRKGGGEVTIFKRTKG